MPCIAEIDAGASQARDELLFLFKLINLVQLPDRVEPKPKIAGTLGFSDILHLPAMGAGNFIRLNKASVGLLESLAALRIFALKNVGHIVEVARHGIPASEPISALLSALEASDSSCASARSAEPENKNQA